MALKTKKTFRLAYRNRSVKFTKEGNRFILLTLGVGVAAINTGNNLLYLILAMMLSFIIVSGILSEQCLRKVRVRRKFPSPIFADSPFSIEIFIKNSKRYFPSFSLQIQDDPHLEKSESGVYYFVLAPKEEVRENYTLTLPHRGLYRFEKVRLHTRFPFGLFLKTLLYTLKDEVIVFPKIDPVGPSVTPFFSKRDEAETNQKGMGTTLFQLRGYQEGDDARAIHWKTSARHAKLLIKENQKEEDKRVVIIFDNRGNKHLSSQAAAFFEKGVSLTASFAFYFLQQGFTLELITANAYFPFGKGKQHLHRILHYLALVGPQPEGSVEEKLQNSKATHQDYRFLILGRENTSWAGKEKFFTRILDPQAYVGKPV